MQSNMISLLDKGMRVLTVGDGDLSFSRSLARLLGPRLTATSYEPRETVLKVYPGVEEIINAIETLGCQILFGVDATKLHEQFKGAKFDTIVWNFPCQAVAKGQDGQNQEMEANKKLIAQFARSCLAVLGDRGTVHITHKTKVRFRVVLIVSRLNVTSLRTINGVLSMLLRNLPRQSYPVKPKLFLTAVCILLTFPEKRCIGKAFLLMMRAYISSDSTDVQWKATNMTL